MSKKNYNKSRENRPRRRNPGFGDPASFAALSGTVVDLLISHALKDATVHEKLLISALLPSILRIIRSIPRELDPDCILTTVTEDGGLTIFVAERPDDPEAQTTSGVAKP